MKTSIIFLLVFVFWNIVAKAQCDTLVINMKDGNPEKIAIFDIKLIKFDNITNIIDETAFKGQLNLIGNYPNPVREGTFIEFEITKPSDVIIEIYNLIGNQVISLKYNNCQSGRNTIYWDCLDANNLPVQSGTYYYNIKTNNVLQTKNLLIIK